MRPSLIMYIHTLPPGKFLVLISARPQGYITAGRIKSIEKSNDFIWNPTSDLPACSIVPQPTTLPRAQYLLGQDDKL
jgi:hypothetical protein